MNHNTETDVEGGSNREPVVSASASAPEVSAPTAQAPQRYEPCDDALNYMQKDRMGDYVLFTDYERTATALAAVQEKYAGLYRDCEKQLAEKQTEIRQLQERLEHVHHYAENGEGLNLERVLENIQNIASGKSKIG